MAQPTPEEITALLTRLSQKPGVQSTLILSRTTGAIVRASGLLSTSDTITADATTAPDAAGTGTGEGSDPKSSVTRQRGLRSAEDVARVVWNFFGQAGATVSALMDDDDEARLVRLRTRRNEIVVVPDSKFLLVCVHDTPPA